MGVYDEHSIAYGIAAAITAGGGRVGITYHPKVAARVLPLVEKLGVAWALPCDVSKEDEIRRLYEHDVTAQAGWGNQPLAFVMHSIAFTPPEGRDRGLLEISMDTMELTMRVSAFSFASVARYSLPLMAESGLVAAIGYESSKCCLPASDGVGKGCIGRSYGANGT